MENEFFVTETKQRRIPWYFSMPWIIANIFIGSILTIIIFYIGRVRFNRNQPTQLIMILGFIFMVIAWAGNIYLFNQFNQ